ncbi:Anoctamin-7 [Mortierella hygrophila]|uniref:Anoctamin-7 n=1 Tax=Mortierella hygrophila TaxID=979708 RepID=A0A9P6K8A4_9FUNG|nr:Anoctamin-7 [Mortierella hygrophila]
MNNHGRDESTVIDLSVINPQRSRPQQYSPPLRSPPVITSPTVSSPNIFNHLSLLDSNDPSSPTVGSPTNESGAGNNNNNNNNNSNNQNRLSKGQAKKGAGGGGSGHGGNGNHETKECPRHADGHPPNRLTTRDLGNGRTVYLFFGSDVILFDTIMTYRLGKPDMLVEDAIDAHGEHQGADAMANLIYGTQAFDMVLKYTIAEHLRKAPPTPEQTSINVDSNGAALSEKGPATAQEGQSLINNNSATSGADTAAEAGNKDLEAGAVSPAKIEQEAKQETYRRRFKKALLKEGLIIEEEPNIDGEEMFVKIYTPFWRLCVEAQRMRFKVELMHAETSKEKAAADAAAAKAKSQGVLHRYFWRFVQKTDNVSLPLRAESLQFKATKLRQYALAEKTRRWSDIVRHGGGIKPDGSGVGSLMGSDGRDGFFNTAQRGRLAESIIVYSKIKTKRGDRHALKTVMDKKAYTDMFTLHDGSYKSKVKPIPNQRSLLYRNWVRSGRTQPLEDIRHYYGEKVALYFAWIEYYTKWLIFAALAGVLFLVYGVSNHFIKGPAAGGDVGIRGQLVDVFDNALTLPYALFMSVWSALFVEYWKRRSAVLAYEWNTLDYENLERARPEFKPTGTRISPVTGKMELYYPRYKQVISIFTSVLVVLISIGIVIVSVGSLMLFNVFMTKSNDPNSIRAGMNSYVTTVVTAVLSLVVIVVLGTIYAKLAQILTDNENHKRLTQYEDALIIKRFLFDFVNFYSAMVYIAFFKGYIAQDVKLWDNQPKDSCGDDGSCLGELAIQLAIVFVGKQLLNQAQEIAIPTMKKWWNKKNELAERAAHLKGKYKNRTKAIKPPQWAKDDLLPAYNPQMFEEYRELVIQFGFCTLFVTAFPIAPIFALLNNILEIRVDAYKILTQHKRPIAQGAQDIGSWSTILMALTHISVFTNACLIAFQSNWMLDNVFMTIPWVKHYDFVKISEQDLNYALLAVQLLFIFIYEHLVFMIKIAIANLVRDTPQTVKLAIQRESYYTRLALDDEEPARDEVLEDVDSDSDESEDEFNDNVYRKSADGALYPPGGLGGGETTSSGEGDDEVNENLEEGEDEEELEAMIKAGGCGCAAHGDGVVGTIKGGFEGTWMNRFRPEIQAAIRRRQQRRRKKQQSANKGQTAE